MAGGGAFPAASHEAALDQARWRKANAVRAVNDALTELLVADRKLHELLGSPARAPLAQRRGADGPAGFATRPAGPEALAWPPEWAR
jgi:hypothetical protein